MFLEVSATLRTMKHDQAGREKAAAAFRKRIGSRSPQWIAEMAGIPDPATVRAFIDGESWPRSANRGKLETLAEMEPGELEAIARGETDGLGGDPVVTAIEGSALSRGDRHRLLSIYFDMLDNPDQQRGEQVV